MLNILDFTTIILLALLFVSQIYASVIEEYTKHNYEPQLDFKKLSIAGVGVRWKKFGPIRAKVYSAGIYLDKIATLAKLRKNQESNDDHSSIITQADIDKSILLQMAREVDSDTMISALSESIQPRLENDKESLVQFEKVLRNGLSEGKVKNKTQFRFDSSSEGFLTVLINGTTKGTIHSKSLIKALFGTYLDRNSVSPTLLEDVNKNIAKWLS